MLHYFKHFLRYRFSIVFLFNLCLCFPKLFHPFQFFLCVIETDMCVHVHSNADVRMSHEVLQCLWIHSRFRHIGTIGVSAHMRRDVRHLHPVDVIVPADHVIESVLPVHCHQRHIIFIVEKESTISINHLLDFGWYSILNDSLKHLRHILSDWMFPCSGINLVPPQEQSSLLPK